MGNNMEMYLKDTSGLKQNKTNEKTTIKIIHVFIFSNVALLS